LPFWRFVPHWAKGVMGAGVKDIHIHTHVHHTLIRAITTTPTLAPAAHRVRHLTTTRTTTLTTTLTTIPIRSLAAISRYRDLSKYTFKQYILGEEMKTNLGRLLVFVTALLVMPTALSLAFTAPCIVTPCKLSINSWGCQQVSQGQTIHMNCTISRPLGSGNSNSQFYNLQFIIEDRDGRWWYGGIVGLTLRPGETTSVDLPFQITSSIPIGDYKAIAQLFTCDKQILDTQKSNYDCVVVVRKGW
jgi:hypothetical protein